MLILAVTVGAFVSSSVKGGALAAALNLVRNTQDVWLGKPDI
jgi:hypothetical protein